MVPLVWPLGASNAMQHNLCCMRAMACLSMIVIRISWKKRKIRTFCSCYNMVSARNMWKLKHWYSSALGLLQNCLKLNYKEGATPKYINVLIFTFRAHTYHIITWALNRRLLFFQLILTRWPTYVTFWPWPEVKNWSWPFKVIVYLVLIRLDETNTMGPILLLTISKGKFIHEYICRSKIAILTLRDLWSLKAKPLTSGRIWRQCCDGEFNFLSNPFCGFALAIIVTELMEVFGSDFRSSRKLENLIIFLPWGRQFLPEPKRDWDSFVIIFHELSNVFFFIFLYHQYEPSYQM